MTIDLLERQFDVQAFVNLPKCRGKFYSSGSGCLLSAFWAGFGFKGYEDCLYTHPDTGETVGSNQLIEATKDLARKLGFKRLDYRFPKRVISKITGKNPTNLKLIPIMSFTGAIITFYDDLNPTVALNLIWEMINRLPNKINTGEKQQVQEQVCQLTKV